MKVRLHRTQDLKKKILLLALFAGVFVTACGTGMLTEEGSFVPAGNQISLVKGGRHSGSWRTDDLNMTYRYSAGAGGMEISGTIRFADRIQYNFISIERFHLKVYLLDEQGRVLDVQGLKSIGSQNAELPVSFRNTLNPSPQTTALAFGYTGSARGTPRSSTQTSFWYVPTQ